MTRPFSIRSVLLSAIGVFAVASAGCLDRPVVPSSPKTTARITKAIPHDAIDKIDLLFMIDNSSSMGDKQELLALAVPDLLSRFLTPNCVDMNAVVKPRTAAGNCPPNTAPEFNPIGDIHIAVVSSSLGSHGADNMNPDGAATTAKTPVCPDASPTNDLAHLLTRGTNPAPNPPFLNWNTKGTGGAGAITVQDTLTSQFKSLVQGIGETGCGYEAQLESIYRFLIDPTPPASLTVDPVGGPNNNPPPYVTAYGPVDTVILQERQQFLRPDSLVAAIAVTDENDCSLSDIANFNLFLVSNGAGDDPYFANTQVNDNTPAAFPGAPTYPNHPNLRCFHQLQRFGVDGLWPVGRYVNGFLGVADTAGNLGVYSNKDGALYPNPLYTDLTCPPAATLAALPNGAAWPGGTNGCVANKSLRADPSFVFLAGIVGVPWQDIANVNPATNAPDLTQGYQTAGAINWPLILGDGLTPNDPFMVESRTPRQTGAADPVTGFMGGAIAAPDSPTPTAAINGHEWLPTGDLQFACTFSIDAIDMNGKDCSAPGAVCDCAGGDPPDMSRNPLCQKADNTFSAVQHYAKAYPCIRELQVLKGVNDGIPSRIGAGAVVASICPSNLTDKTAPDYGYRPAVGAIVDKLKTKLKQQCFNRSLELADACCGTRPNAAAYDQVNCIILEDRPINPGDTCTCANDPMYPGRVDIPAGDLAAVPDNLQGPGHCTCEIQQLAGGMNQMDQNTCLTNATVTDDTLPGWCYIDPARGLGNIAIVSKCGAADMRTVRYPPRTGATAYISCQEAAFDSASVDGGVAGGASCTAPCPP